jgi:WXG100 family type VII secretion target
MMKAVLALLFGHRSLFTMGTIHVNTDLMRQLGSLFAQLNEQIASQLEPQIQHLIGQLESDWLGVSRQHFETALSEWRATASRLVVNGEELGRHLQETATRFDNADQF